MRRPQRGVTLIELIVVLALTAILVSFGISFIATPVQTLETSSQREQLAAEAALASASIARDLRAALPGSVRVRRVGSVTAVELIPVLDSTTALPDALATGAAQLLALGAPDGSFETLGNFPLTTLPVNTTALRLATHDPASALSPYANLGTLTPVGTRLSISAGSVPGQSLIQLLPAMAFSAIGAQRRLYLVAGPVTYLCEAATGLLRRFSGYSLAANQAQRDTAAKLLAAGAAVALIADQLQDCQLSLQTLPSAQQSAATMTLQFTANGATLATSETAVLDDAG
jgi:MSHA biogenesis protein MshO